ncbi:secretory pathway protein Sec39-domain-containing protein [Phascolomyces articulosus]|uniref:Secretory pathway protein Sec39-domain-containing protein n=1 Tax=Phascolomyces articulosus TaxID=60185 RepID=A0AAD5PCD1_9FUNG|nr:secretory pathway protein Sec39-domain-containing protein [Phascolomyces articulosus]
MEHSTTHDFLFHLNQGNYQAALDTAKDLGLDTDIIYKKQWTKRSKKELTTDDIDLLDHVQHDKAWVVSQCLETLADDASLQQKILDIGLAACLVQQEHQTNDAMTTTTDTNEINNETNTLWLRARLYLLQYADRLKTFNVIWPTLQKTTDFATGYNDFRDANLIAQAIEYAQTENATALRALFVHHGAVVLPYRFSILAAIPETAEPSQFDLPQQRPHEEMEYDDDNEEAKGGKEDEWMPQQPWRDELDVSESVGDVIENPTPEHTAYMAWIGQQVDRSDYPASAEVVTQWYVDRSAAADRIGLASQALEWVRYARLMDVTGLDTREAQLDWLCKYVYSGGHGDQDNTVVDLDMFKKTITPYEVVDTLLNQTDATRIVNDMKQLVLPWLNVCSTIVSPDEDESVDMILYRWLLDAADKGHFDWCCLVFEHSKPTLPDDERIIKNDEDLARLALALFYTTPGSIETQVRTFESLPVFDVWELGEHQDKEKHIDMGALLPLAETPLGLFTVLQEVGPYGLTQMMDTLQAHLQYAEVLARYHASVSLRWYLEDHSVDTQRQMCIRLASQAGSAHLDDDKEWRELLDEMMGLQEDNNGKGVFAKLTRTEIFETFFSSLLRCGRFRLAKDLMVGPNRDKTLDIGRAEQLVLDAEQEFFDNATTGNMHDGNMKLAMECLNILPPTDMVNEEKDLIVATHTLISEYHVMDRPGIELMPIQVRRSTNRLDLISKLINSRRGIYRQPTQVLDLTHKLGYQEDLLAQVRVLAMLASAALVDEDFDMSYKLCCATVDKVRSIETHPHRRRYRMEDINQAAWQACFNLGKVELFDNPRKRLDVLAMALELTPAENVSEVLSVWRKLDRQVPPSDLEWLEDAHQDVVDASSVVTARGEDGKGVGWNSLLDSARRQQWRLGDLLKAGGAGGGSGASSPEVPEGKRKRDQLREMVGGWLF